MGWFRRYFEASDNSGSAATLYAFLSVFPTALAGVAYFHPAGGDANAFADRLVAHLGLTGSGASLVRDTFGTASTNALAATFVVVVSFLMWGLGIGPTGRSGSAPCSPALFSPRSASVAASRPRRSGSAVG